MLLSTWLYKESWFKNTNIELDYMKDTAKLVSGKNFLLLLKNKIRGGISSVMSDRYVQSTSGVESDENIKLLYIDANNLYGWASVWILESLILCLC